MTYPCLPKRMKLPFGKDFVLILFVFLMRNDD